MSLQTGGYGVSFFHNTRTDLGRRVREETVRRRTREGTSGIGRQTTTPTSIGSRSARWIAESRQDTPSLHVRIDRSGDKYLSIVIPAWNEERRLPRTLGLLTEFLTEQSLEAEVIVVDSGSTDKTVEVATSFRNQLPNLRVITIRNRLGKGHAVRTGMLAAKGNRRMFMDADCATPLTEIAKLAGALDDGVGVAYGSIGLRSSTVEKPESLVRRTLGNLGNLIIRALVLPGIRDSQRGFKMFTADATVAIFSNSVINGWAFDVEALALAKHFGIRTREIGIRWHHDSDSGVTPTAYLQVLRDVVRVRLRLWHGAYDREANPD